MFFSPSITSFLLSVESQSFIPELYACLSFSDLPCRVLLLTPVTGHGPALVRFSIPFTYPKRPIHTHHWVLGAPGGANACHVARSALVLPGILRRLTHLCAPLTALRDIAWSNISQRMRSSTRLSFLGIIRPCSLVSCAEAR